MIQTDGVVPKDRGQTRKAIRKKVTEILLGKTLAKDRVFPNSSMKLSDDELPAILIYPTSEPAELYATAPRELRRPLSLQIEIVAKGPEQNSTAKTPKANEPTLDDILDDLAEEVEKLMSEDETLGGTCSESILTATDIDTDSAGSEPIGSARLTYTVTYYTMSPRADGTFPDFKTNKVEYNISDINENTREAEDTVDIDI